MSDSSPGEPETGGVGTMPRPAAPPRVPPRRPRRAGPRPGLAGGRPAPAASPRGPADPRGNSGEAAHRGRNRMPFFLLLCVLLGGALICTLVISTTLAAGSFEISKLQNSTIAQARQLQSLQEQVAQAQSASQIASRATELGMRPVGELMFVDLKTGKLATDGTDWPGYVPPGYTP